MRKTALFFLILCSLTLRAQHNAVEKIQIYHTYEDLYISYIVPLSCADCQEHGPIIITDRLKIRAIEKLVNKSRQCNKVQTPDVRFKIEFFSTNCIDTLCFGQSNEGMYLQNKKYEYNPQLCSYIIKLIEDSGAEKPQKILPTAGRDLQSRPF